MPQKKLSIRIDGELVSAFEGQTILEAARAANKQIPTLCYMAGLSGGGGLPGVHRRSGRHSGACCPPAPRRCRTEMAVITNSPKLTRYRRIAVELLLVERNHICAVCVSNGHCELQSLAQIAGRHQRPLSLQLPEAAGGHVAHALRAGPQSLRALHALRECLRGGGGGACLGGDGRAASVRASPAS